MVHPQKLFEKLNTALAEQQITLSIICVGGLALSSNTTVCAQRRILTHSITRIKC